MYLLIIVMPLLSSILAGFFGRKIGITGAQTIACSLLIFTTVLAIVTFTEIEQNGSPVSIYLFKWVDLESLDVYFGFNFDSLTTLMLIPVLFVSSLVHIYSIGYMSHDPHNQRFFSYLSLFTFMMIILVTANNYLLMFVGWEGVGICSYLLVSFWFTRIAANQSSIAAILTNRVGDCFLTIGMFAIIWSLGNLDYATIFSLSPFVNENIVTIIGICLLIGAMAKSSQIGLHVWLPMAMEGPTPVSALIHAATMVTAGVYLLIRSSPLIEYSATVLLLCLWIGAITSLISSLIGLFQQDIKKVIAYSTMSQLGLMVVAIGLSSYTIALFHLVNHAFYKALLFLGAGSVIHAVADKQDFRKYGGLKRYLPLSHSVMLIASLSLVAFPFMTGYFSKDSIIESCYGKYDFSAITAYYIVTLGAMFTTLYSVKTLYLTFETNPNGSLQDHKNIHEGNIYMSLPLIILALFSVYFGFITRDMFIGLGSDFFADNSIFIHPSNDIMINTEFAVPTLYKLLPFILTITLIVISFLLSEYLVKILMWFKFTILGNNLFSFFNLRFLIELVYNKYITEKILKSGEHTSRVLDRGAIELIGPYGLESTTSFLSKNLSSLDTGVVTTYAVYILIAGLTYLCIPYTSLLPMYIFIILFFIFTNKTDTTSIINIENFPTDVNTLDVTSKDNLKSGFNYVYILKRILRVTIIAIVLWCIREIIVILFELNRHNLLDYITIANISAIVAMIIESMWSTPMYQEIDSNERIEYFKKLKKSALLVSVNASTSSPPSSVSSESGRTAVSSSPSTNNSVPEQPFYGPYHDSGVANSAAFCAGQLVTGIEYSLSDDEAASTFGFSTPYTSYNNIWGGPLPPQVGNLVGDEGVITGKSLSWYVAGQLVECHHTAYFPSVLSPQQDPNNPVIKGGYYDYKAYMLNEMPREIIGRLSSMDPDKNLRAHLHEYKILVNKTRAHEAWGIYDSVEHRQLMEYRKADPNMTTYLPLEYPPQYAPGVYYTGTAPGSNSFSLLNVNRIVDRNMNNFVNSGYNFNALDIGNAHDTTSRPNSPTLTAINAHNAASRPNSPTLTAVNPYNLDGRPNSPTLTAINEYNTAVRLNTHRITGISFATQIPVKNTSNSSNPT